MKVSVTTFPLPEETVIKGASLPNAKLPCGNVEPTEFSNRGDWMTPLDTVIRYAEDNWNKDYEKNNDNSENGAVARQPSLRQVAYNDWIEFKDWFPWTTDVKKFVEHDPSRFSLFHSLSFSFLLLT